MYRSGITAESLIARLRTEADITVPVADISYFVWINTVEQLLYSEYVKDYRRADVVPTSENMLSLGDISHSDLEGDVRFSDIYRVYADGSELLPVTLSGSSIIERNRFWDNGDGTIGYDYFEGSTPNKVTIVYFARPTLKSEVNKSNEICLPPEFIELITSRLRGETYKLVNNDVLAQKWLETYNNYLNEFKIWISERESRVYGE